jgi:hypothetical protein
MKKLNEKLKEYRASLEHIEEWQDGEDIHNVLPAIKAEIKIIEQEFIIEAYRKHCGKLIYDTGIHIPHKDKANK